MRLNPYLTFNGQCEAAFKFYEKCLGGRIEAMFKFGDTPAAQHVPPDWGSKIMHAALKVGDDVLMGSDSPRDRYEGTKGFSVSLQFTRPEDAERVFNALAENGNIQMALCETFWAARFGMLVDQFGIPWMINCAPAR
ncbi:MAG: VOC family protein [Pirellulales bacterium]